jgi:hypothetical protein
MTMQETWQSILTDAIGWAGPILVDLIPMIALVCALLLVTAVVHVLIGVFTRG